MPLEQLQTYLPWVAVIAGLLVLLWGQRDRLAGWLARLWPKPKIDSATAPATNTTMGPAERFITLYALRTWCQEAGHQEAVKALDSQVLPVIIQGGPKS
jgi:hypothetical protein